MTGRAAVCSQPGCGRPHYARSLCRSHYNAGGGRLLAEILTERATDLSWLLDAGVSPQEALDRVGWGAEAATRWAQRHDWSDLAHALLPAYRAHQNAKKARARARRAVIAGAAT